MGFSQELLLSKYVDSEYLVRATAPSFFFFNMISYLVKQSLRWGGGGGGGIKSLNLLVLIMFLTNLHIIWMICATLLPNLLTFKK